MMQQYHDFFMFLSKGDWQGKLSIFSWKKKIKQSLYFSKANRYMIRYTFLRSHTFQSECRKEQNL